MRKNQISGFMLERYKIGELSPEEQQAIAEALKTDGDLRCRLAELDESDRELRLRYPAAYFGLENGKQLPKRRFINAKAIARLAGLAAAIALCIILPVLYFTLKGSTRDEVETNNGFAMASAPANAPAPVSDGFQTDRTKGRVPAGSELYIFLKDEQEAVLPNQTVLHEGNTVQLAYTAPAGAECYGVIFSIDGRSAVTMHYPYRRGQSSLLASGKRIFLNEAYILDDAPDYEVFVLVVSGEPLDAEAVLRDAWNVAEQTETAEMIKEISEPVFETCEIETITVLKK